MSSIGTELITGTCNTCHDALRIFGEFSKGGRAERLPIVLIPRNAGFPWVSIPNGVYAFKKVRGKKMHQKNVTFEGVLEKKPMEPGFHWMAPWEHVAFIITPQYTFFDTPVQNCPTKDNIRVKIDVFLMFRIVEPYKFIFSLSAEKLTGMLKDAQAEAVREIAQKTTHHQIYDLVLFEEDEIIKEMNERFSQYGVEIADINITDVALPNDIRDRLQNETTFQIHDRFQKRRQEFAMLKTQNEEEIKQLRLKYENERLAYEENEKKRRAEIIKEIDEIRARTEKLLNEIESEQKRVVDRIREEAENYSQKLDAKKKAILLEMNAKGQARARQLLIEAEAYAQEVKSKTNYVVTENMSKALKIMADSEEQASRKMKEKRKYVEDENQVEILKGLAINQQSIIHGNANGNIVAEVHASKLANSLYSKK